MGLGTMLRQRYPLLATGLLALLLAGCLGAGGGSDGGTNGGTGDNSDAGSGNNGGDRNVGGDSGDNSGSTTDPLAASEYRSAYIIGDTKDDGSPIASNHPEGFNNPSDVAVSEDHFFVADRSNSRISKFELNGDFVTNWSVEGPGKEPTGVALGPSGTLHVAKFDNGNIDQYQTDGTPFRTYGSFGDGIYRMAVGPDYAYVADSRKHRIMRYETGTSVSPSASLGGRDSGWQSDTNAIQLGAASGSGEGYFTEPRGVAVDPGRGYLYVADTKNSRVQQFDLDTGQVVDVWGEEGNSQPPDFAWPGDVAVDDNGNVYVTDISDRIRKFTHDGTFVASFGASGSGEGEMRVPVGIAVGDDGSIYVAEDTPNHRVQKFVPVSGSEAAIAGDASGKAGPGALATVDAGPAEDAAIAVLQDLGLAAQSQGLVRTMANGSKPGVRDYVTTEVDDDGYRRVRMWIGPGGNIIPSGEWRDAHPDYCGQNERLKGAVNLLNIKVYPVDDTYFAFAQYIDVSTGKILEQREGQDADLQDAINEAWNNLNTSVGATTSPCEQIDQDFRFSFRTEFSEKLTIDSGEVRTDKQAISASGPLTYNSEESQFEGSAELSWTTYYKNTSASGFGYVECSAPSTGKVDITYKSGPDAKPTDSVEAEIDFVDVENPDCASKDTLDSLLDDQLSHELPYYWQQHHPEAFNANTGTFTIEDWKSVPSSESSVAEKRYDFTDTDDSSFESSTLVYEEDTTIRIMK